MGFGYAEERPCNGCKQMFEQLWVRGDRNLYCWNCKETAPEIVRTMQVEEVPYKAQLAELEKLRNAVHTASFIFERLVQGHCTDPELNQAAWDFLEEWPGDYAKFCKEMDAAMKAGTW